MGAPASRPEPGRERLGKRLERRPGNQALACAHSRPLTFSPLRTNSGRNSSRSSGKSPKAPRPQRKGERQMERFFGGNPSLVLLRLIILSLIVGVVLAALGFSPYEIIDSIARLVERIYNLGFEAIEKAVRYFLLGAVIVFPIWLVVRLFKFAGRDETDLAETRPKREA